jgi:hypothetical protein
MKKRKGVVLAVVAFFIGAATGFSVSSYCWKRSTEDIITSHSLERVASAYHTLKFIEDGQTDSARYHLRSNLVIELQVLDTLSAFMHRPDLLTNSVVVNARAFEKGLIRFKLTLYPKLTATTCRFSLPLLHCLPPMTTRFAPPPTFNQLLFHD